MKNSIQKTAHHYSKFITLFCFLLMAFTFGDSRSEYLVPTGACPVFSSDLDLDNDKDIVVGCYYFPQTEWSGIVFLENNGDGYFNLTDSLYMYGSQNIIYSINIKGDSTPEILGRYYDGQQTNVAIIEINNGNYDISYYPMCDKLSRFDIGDINGDSFYDIVFISNNNFLWGIIYNDGTGNFSEPEYFDLNYPPNDIECADFNNDSRSDIVIASATTEVYFSTDTGFVKQVLGYTWTGGCTLIVSDFDNDKDIDILKFGQYYNNTNRIYMFKNIGNNEFSQQHYFDFSPFCSYAQTADFNNDSLPDMIFTTNNNSGLYIYHNIGNFIIKYRQFIPHEKTNPKGLFCEDYDNNGYIDIAFTSGVGGIDYYLNILFNDGKGIFQEYPISNNETPNSQLQNRNLQCFPNPFSNKTTISISLNKNEKIRLEIYDIQGKLIKTFVYDKPHAGVYKIIWNGDDLNGKEIQAGIYFYSLIINGKVSDTKKMLVVK
jgi:hypothetical protein